MGGHHEKTLTLEETQDRAKDLREVASELTVVVLEILPELFGDLGKRVLALFGGCHPLEVDQQYWFNVYTLIY